MTSGVLVLIPVKDHARAKLRMSPLLSDEERTRLAAAMFEDLIGALHPLAGEFECAVLTNDSRAADRAKALGWRLLLEKEQISESISVDRASRALASEGFESVLRLPADIPLVRTGDIEEILSCQMGAGTAVLVPSRDGTGTNAVLRSPPALFPSRFGTNSLVLHRQEGDRVQAGLRILTNERVAFDLDEPADVMKFMQVRCSTATRRLLEQLSAVERLKPDVI